MQAVRVHPNSDSSSPYSETNPAPSSALVLDSDLPIPQPLNPGEILIKVEATTIIRDSLTWPETYSKEYTVPGHDFAGTVVAVNEKSDPPPYQVGDEVYGMADAARGGMWAEYAIVTTNEACLKPKALSWAQAAAVPLSALTAYQALFDKAGLTLSDTGNVKGMQTQRSSERSTEKSSLLITGAAGGVGLYLVQLAKLTGLYVVAATSSNARNKEFLTQLGADETIEYKDMLSHDSKSYDVIIDAVGGQVLESCWSIVSHTGTIVSIDSASFGFVQEHRAKGLSSGKDKVKALFFIVSPLRKDLEDLSAILEAGLLEPFVAQVVPLADAKTAYDNPFSAPTARGKTVLKP